MLILVQRSVLRWKRQMLGDFGCFHSEIPQERMKTVKLELIKKWASRYPCQISPNKAPTFDMTRLHTTSLESLIFLKRNLITFPYFRKVLAKTARQMWTPNNKTAVIFTTFSGTCGEIGRVIRRAFGAGTDRKKLTITM